MSGESSPFVDPDYLRYQYDDSEKLRIRIETHRRYTEGGDDFEASEIHHVDPRPGHIALDVGCGTGGLVRRLRALEVRAIGLDRSAGMVTEAREADVDGMYLRSDACALPFPDGVFDRVSAMGVLYHIADWTVALREMSRVTRRGGRVIVSTNGPDAMKAIYDVHAEAALELGYTPLPFSGSQFHLGHLEEVRGVMPSAERSLVESALVFREAEPAVSFYASNRIDMIQQRPADNSHRAPLIQSVRQRIQRVIEREGAFRVPKSYGYVVAEMD